MLEDIEKSFDTAFFNADHLLKQVHQIIANFEDVVLSDDLTATVGASMASIGSQLSTMAFCFAQLMCKTILYSENYFILKERFQHLQIENLNLKSDKSFMDFVRKLNLICLNSKSSSKSSKSKQDSPLGKSSRKKLICESSNSSNSRSPHKRKSAQRSPSKTNCLKANKDQNNAPNSSATSSNQRSSGFAIYTAPENEGGLEDSLLNNGNRKYLQNNVTFRMHRLNNDAFKLIYRNFKEVELINELNYQNVSLQKEVVSLKSELANYRLVVKYLNNQMSGRIQQIQLLNRDKKDANFEQVWSDLESEIQLNKFKTIAQALASNQQKSLQSSSLFTLLNTSSSMPNSPSIIKPSSKEVVLDSPSQSTSVDESDVSLLHESQSVSSAIDVNSFEEEDLLRSKLKNFNPSWFSVGLLRFVFVNLVDEAIGISIIGGREFNLPIIVAEVHAHTPASRVGAFKPGDIILSVNFIDFTDQTHETAVSLLKNLSGNTRFGVIYFKPDEQRYQQLCSWPSPSTLSASTTNAWPNAPSLVDMPALLRDYYRSVFNTFISVPFTFQSDHSSLPSVVSSDNDSDLSRCSSSAESNEPDDGDDDIFDNKPTVEAERKQNAIRANRPEQISPALDIRMGAALLHADSGPSPSRKAFPGMAARLSSATFQM